MYQLVSVSILTKSMSQQYETNSLTVYSTEGRYIESVGREGNKELEFQFPRGVAVSNVNDIIYICEVNNYRIQCLNSDLTFNSFIPNITSPFDIKLTPQNIVVLILGSPCLKFYDYSHQLIGELITQGEGNQTIQPHYFCLDRYFNILLTEFSADFVMIFSDRGELLHKFGKRGEGRGDLISPTGIATDGEGRIIVEILNIVFRSSNKVSFTLSVFICGTHLY